MVGSWAVASLSINYYHIINTYYGIMFSNILYKPIAKNWKAVSALMLDRDNHDVAALYADANITVRFVKLKIEFKRQ